MSKSCNCTTCNSDNDGADLWDLSDREKLCQMCWEKSCSDAFWDFFGSVEDVAVGMGEGE